jgi:hypothetical protein
MRYFEIINNSTKNIDLSKDLSLLTAIERPINLNEFKLLNDFVIPNHDFTPATKIGTLSTIIGILDIYRMFFNNSNLFYGLIDANLGLTTPVCYIGFNYKDGLPLLRKNSYCIPEHRNKGLISELNLFIANAENQTMISDVHMSTSGLKTWEKLFKMCPNQTGIFHGPTLNTYPLHTANTIHNGVFVVDPKDDNLSNYYWFQKPKTGQKWFYIFQSKIQPPITEAEHLEFNIQIRNLGNVPPKMTFGKGFE